MKVTFESRPADDPWRGVQPKYERVVRMRLGAFGLVTKLPSGDAITVPLAGHATFINRLNQ